ncbi:MAG: hypothetical protein L6R40_006595 [Gallowayella cf. fulva]|nr:MAG: hypothetical protein L6R40_006595 [Xanthomendoza cf. fulva]
MFSFNALKHALGRRGTDYHHFLTSTIPPIQRPDFQSLYYNVWEFEAAISRVPPVLPSGVQTRVVATLNSITADVVAFSKEIELNPFRIQRRAPNARREDVLEAMRIEKFHEWRRILEAVEVELNMYWNQKAEKKLKRRQAGSRL